MEITQEVWIIPGRDKQSEWRVEKLWGFYADVCRNHTVTVRCHYTTRSPWSSWERGQGWGERSQLLHSFSLWGQIFSESRPWRSLFAVWSYPLVSVPRSLCGFASWSVLSLPRMNWPFLTYYCHIPEESPLAGSSSPASSSHLTLFFSSPRYMVFPAFKPSWIPPCASLRL